jgi:predicted amidohydrolase
MRIALATIPVAISVDDGLNQMHRCIVDAASQRAKIICFPEAYIPGLRGLDFEVPAFDVQEQQRVIEKVSAWARQYQVAVICSMEWHTEAGRQIAAAVIDANGKLLGVQTKNQLDPSEEPLYVPGRTRQLFEIDGLKFGITICHEGFRYPETVRWAATRGAQIVFHPHCTGSDKTGTRPTVWGDPQGAYYEKAIMCRALENTIYFASVNYGFANQESASCVIDPTGACLAYQPYGEAGVLGVDIDVTQATGKLAKRLAPERYQEQRTN